MLNKIEKLFKLREEIRLLKDKRNEALSDIFTPELKDFLGALNSKYFVLEQSLVKKYGLSFYEYDHAITCLNFDSITIGTKSDITKNTIKMWLTESDPYDNTQTGWTIEIPFDIQDTQLLEFLEKDFIEKTEANCKATLEKKRQSIVEQKKREIAHLQKQLEEIERAEKK